MKYSIEQWTEEARKSQQRSDERRRQPQTGMLPSTWGDWCLVLVVVAILLTMGLLLSGWDLR